MKKYIFLILTTALMIVSCGSHKTITDSTPVSQMPKASTNTGYVSKVIKNTIPSQNLVAKVDVTLLAKGKDITVDGKLQMRRNKTIRITLTALGLMEVGRMEFTPEYFMIIDRINKQYVKASYNDIAFLKDNGVDFYTLQSLFWNELFLPGKQTLTEKDGKSFNVEDLADDKRSISYSGNRLSLNWTAAASTALINSAKVSYSGGRNGSVTFDYDKFADFSGKKFPTKVKAAFNDSGSGATNIGMNLSLGRLSDDSKWDAETTVTSKYTEVTLEGLLKSLMK